jgi:hypothetical protein
MINYLLVAHIVVLGYWLGSEFVINSTYRLVCYADDMPFKQRDQLMDHVMNVDQHVRYALILQFSLGSMLAASYGFIPGGSSLVAGAAFFGIAWLIFAEAVHRLRKRPSGQILGRIDRGTRYFLLLIIVAIATGMLGDTWPMPSWLRWKLVAFGGVVACGVGIRIVLSAHFQVWARMAEGSVSIKDNDAIKQTYVKATSVLVLLWIFIAIATFLSIAKPV